MFLQHRFFRSKGVAISWLLVITVLFMIPGSALPKENLLTRIRFDLWVHAGFFGVLFFLWRSSMDHQWRKYFFRMLLLGLVYAVAIEIIQHYWIPYRSFDLFDVVADMTGAFIGLFVWRGVYKKNKPL